MEVLDVDDNAAIRFLMDSGVSKALSMHLVGYFSGRLIHLVNSVCLYNSNRIMEDDIYVIQHDLFSLKLARQTKHIVIRFTFGRLIDWHGKPQQTEFSRILD